MKKLCVYPFAISFLVGPILLAVWIYKAMVAQDMDIPFGIALSGLTFGISTLVVYMGYEYTLKDYHKNKLKKEYDYVDYLTKINE